MAARWTGDYVTSLLVFRAEKRSAQASAYPSYRLRLFVFAVVA